MHIFSLDRGIMVVVCFVLWIGAAGLVCWMLVPTVMPDESAAVVNPAAVVKAQSVGVSGLSAQVMVAQR
jgi:hypothetical protein